MLLSSLRIGTDERLDSAYPVKYTQIHLQIKPPCAVAFPETLFDSSLCRPLQNENSHLDSLSLRIVLGV